MQDFQNPNPQAGKAAKKEGESGVSALAGLIALLGQAKRKTIGIDLEMENCLSLLTGKLINSARF